MQRKAERGRRVGDRRRMFGPCQARAIGAWLLLAGLGAANVCRENATLGDAVLQALKLSWPGLEAAANHFFQ